MLAFFHPENKINNGNELLFLPAGDFEFDNEAAAVVRPEWVSPNGGGKTVLTVFGARK